MQLHGYRFLGVYCVNWLTKIMCYCVSVDA